MPHLKNPGSAQKSENRRSLVGIARWSALTAFTLILTSQTAASHAATKAGQDYPPRPGATPIVIGVSGTPTTNHLGVLTTTQQQLAVRDALHDYFVKSLLRGHRYTIKGASAWITGAGNMGGLVKLRFSRPVNLSGLWLKGNRVLFRASYRQIAALRVYVDLRQNLVLQIAPKKLA